MKKIAGGSLANLMKPADLMKPAHSKAAAGKAGTHAKKVPKPADLSDIHKQVNTHTHTHTFHVFLFMASFSAI